MAPQNSTLIHENAELASDLSRYSPISKDEAGGGSRSNNNNMNGHDIEVLEVNILDKDDDNDDNANDGKSISSSEDINILQVRE